MPEEAFLTMPETDDRRKWWILANVSVGTFMATLDGSIANVGLPTISVALHVPLHTVQWVITVYLLTICAILPIVGKLADLFGRGRLYNIGFLIFSGGSALCAVSGSIGVLIGARILQALGASLLMANSQAIVTTTFPANQRGRALGITGTMVSLGSLTGPALGGLLIGWFGWSSIFWINVPIGILGFVLGLWMLPKTREERRSGAFDYAGSGLFVVGIVTLLYTVSNAEVWGWNALVTWAGIAMAIVVLAGFGLRERWAANPMIDFSLYRNRMFFTGSIAALLSFISLFCTNTMMPFYLEDVLRASPQTTGLTMAAYPLAMAFVAPFSGWLSDRVGPYWLTTSGLLLNGLGFVLLNLLAVDVPVWLVGLHLTLFGIGQGLFQSPNNSSVMGSVPRAQVGSAGGLNALVRNIGMVLGISLSVSLFSARLNALVGRGYNGILTEVHPILFMDALHVVFWAAAAVCVAGALLSALRPKRSGPAATLAPAAP